MAGTFQRLRTEGVDLETLRRIGPIQRGVPRSQVTVPISPDGRVDDTVLFQDPADAAKVYYLPRYRLRVTPATAHYEITTELVDGLWRMTFGLESFPAPEISRGDAVILPHELVVSVSSGGQLARDYPVAEFRPGLDAAQNRPEVVLRLSLPERDALLRAFTRDDEQARLVVRRSISVAVPLVVRQPGPAGEVMIVAKPDRLKTHLILPDLVVDDGPNPIPEPIRHVEPGPIRWREPDPHPEWLNRGQLLKQLGQPAEAVRLGRVDVRQQLVVDQSFARFAVQPAVAAEPLLARNVVRDHRAARPEDIIVRDHRRRLPDDFPVPEPDPDPIIVVDDPEPEPRFLIVSTALDVIVPLRFDVDSHPYLFPSGQPPASRGFTTLVVPWPAEGPASRNHVYFQDQAAGNVFYYLPDAFLVGRLDEAPFGPELTFTVGRVTDAQSGTERALALISAHLVPQSSPARLLDARTALAGHVPAGGHAPELRPAVHPAACRLELPGGAITTQAPPDLLRGWWISESFPFDDLRDVYAVLTTGGDASALLRGRVDVDVAGEVHQVPVEVRLDRPAIPPLTWTERPGTAGAITLTLRNAGDVEVILPELPAWVSAGGQLVPATVTGALPGRLAAGATLDLTVTPIHEVPAEPDATLDVTLDVTGVRLLVDPEQAVRQTLDRRVERLPRPVTLITTPGGLGTSGDPERDLFAIGVQFEGVSAAQLLDHTTLRLDLAVPVPLVDWLLDRGLGAFRFRQTLVHLSGSSQNDKDWRSLDGNLLPLPLPPLP